MDRMSITKMRPMSSLTKKKPYSPTIQCSTLTYLSGANKVKIINHSIDAILTRKEDEKLESTLYCKITH